MNSRTILATLTFLFATFLTWQLRWVLLIVFGAIVVAVGFDVLIRKIQSFIKIGRDSALAIVLILLIGGGLIIYIFLAPELITQAKDLGTLAPNLIED